MQSQPGGQKELLTLTIEISEGHNETTIVNEGDNPSVLAY